MARKTNCVKGGIPYYRITAVVGYDEVGKPKRKEFYGSCKADAEAKRDEYLNGIKSGLEMNAVKRTVGQLFKVWLYEIKRMDSSLKATSFERYEGVYRLRIKNAALMGLPIMEVKSLHIQRYLNTLAKDGATYSQMREARKVIKMFFIYATEQGYVVKDPCVGVTIPGEKPTKKEIEVFTDEEIRKIKASVQSHRLRFLILLALGTGLRKGELLALRYEDIEDGVVHVRHSLAGVAHIDEDGNRNREMLIWGPKSESSIRDVPIPAELMKELEHHKARQAAERLKAGIGGRSELIFTTETGNLLEESNLNRAYKRILRNAGVPYKKFHTLRHTFATKLIQAGVDIKTVQELMGHSDISITMIYLHSDMETKKKAAATLNRLFVGNVD